MSDDIRAKAETALKEVEKVTQTILPEPEGESILIDQASGEEQAAIQSRMAELDMQNTQSIIQFGSGAQAELQTISQAMLDGVRNKDIGPAGASLREIVSSLRGWVSIDRLRYEGAMR